MNIINNKNKYCEHTRALDKNFRIETNGTNKQMKRIRRKYGFKTETQNKVVLQNLPNK